MTDVLAEGLLHLQEGLLEAEDRLTLVCAVPAALPIYEGERRGRTYTKKERREGGRVLRQPVGYLHFDGECLSWERDGEVVDVLQMGTEDSWWVCQAVRMLPDMHQRLRADAATPVEDLETAVAAVRAFLSQLQEEDGYQ